MFPVCRSPIFLPLLLALQAQGGAAWLMASTMTVGGGATHIAPSFKGIPSQDAPPKVDLDLSKVTNPDGTVRILGFGSLLSEESAKSTFRLVPGSFRFVRVEGYRRVFTHPASIFFQREIAVPAKKAFSSLSTEVTPGCGFIASLFDMEGFNMDAFVQREEEFDFVEVPFTTVSLDGDNDSGTKSDETPKSADTDVTNLIEEASAGLMCVRSTDEKYIQRWGHEVFADRYGKYGITSIWDEWGPDSGILPCPIYLRHCVLAAMKAGPLAFDSFMDETFLSDRVTTVRQYMEENPAIMGLVPPEHLIGRYSG